MSEVDHLAWGLKDTGPRMSCSKTLHSFGRLVSASPVSVKEPINGALLDGVTVNVPATWRYPVAQEMTLKSFRLLDAEDEYVAAVNTKRL